MSQGMTQDSSNRNSTTSQDGAVQDGAVSGNARYQRAYLSSFGLNQLDQKNPLMASIWSLFFPGLGNLYQDRNLKGLLLIMWGTVVNSAAHINLAVWLSLTGQFQLAKQAVDTRWFLLYVAVYVYAAWDAYRGTVGMNRLYLLADREDAPFQPFVIQALDINYLDQRSPWLAAGWSAMAPGLGNLYLHKIIPGIFFIGWTITVVYLSHALQVIHLSLIGDFVAAKHVSEIQWLMYIPAIYGYQVYDSYNSAVEFNRLFAKEQSKWLRDNYQHRKFELPI